MSKQSTKIAGVYMIRNKINGKVYIGQSVDVRFRWKRYLWAVNSTASYSETKRSITKALREYGPENFEFKILDADPKCQDAYYRYEREAELIAKYKSYDPDYGYNSTTGFEGYLYYGEYKPRKQQRREILKRAKPIYLYDTKEKRALLVFGGAKTVGDIFGHGKDVMSHIVKRGSIFKDRYYLIPANKSERKIVIDKIRRKKIDTAHPTKRNQTRAEASYKAYMKAVEDTLAIMESE